MTVKLIAAAAVLLGCGYMGIAYAMSYRRRTAQLTELLCLVNRLEFDVDFMGLPLCEAFERAAAQSERAIGDVFSYISKRLRENRCEDMERLWARAFNRYKFELYIKEEDIKILLDLSKNLGSGDREKEKNNLKMAEMRLKIAEEEARYEEKKNMKIYRGLGFLVGIFIVIVLI